MTVRGYSRVDGDCGGHDIKQMTGTRSDCGQVCDLLADCKGYIYIIAAEQRFPHPPCYLKNKMCSKPKTLQGLDVSAYYKVIIAGNSFRV